MSTQAVPAARWALILCTLLAAVGCGGMEGDFLDGLNVDDETRMEMSFDDLGVSLWTGNDAIAGKSYLSHSGASFSVMQPSSGSAAALQALQEHGYISEEPTEINQTWTGAMIGYELTAKGKQHFKPDKNVLVGRREATEVIDYIEEERGSVVTVMYEYEVELNDLGEDLGLDEQDIGQGGEGEAAFLKSAKGWRLQYASW